MNGKSHKAEVHYEAFSSDPRWQECTKCKGLGWIEYAEHNYLEEPYIDECPNCKGYGGSFRKNGRVADA